MALLSAIARSSIAQRVNFDIFAHSVRTLRSSIRPVPVNDNARTPEDESRRVVGTNQSQPTVRPISQKGFGNESSELPHEQVEKGLPSEPVEREFKWNYTDEEKAIFAKVAEIANDDALKKRTMAITAVDSRKPGTLTREQITTLVQKTEVLAKLAHFQVPVEEWEDKPDLVNKLVSLNWRRDCDPCIEQLVQRTGMKPKDLRALLTKNPLVLTHPLQQIERRLEYLSADMSNTLIVIQKRCFRRCVSRVELTDQYHLIFVQQYGGWGMTANEVCNVVTREKFWLSYSMVCLKNRMQFLMKQFALSQLDLKQLIIKNPKVITWDLRRLVLFKCLLVDKMGFSMDQTSRLLLAVPQLVFESDAVLLKRFKLIRKMGLEHEAIVDFPKIFLLRDYQLEQRLGFLEHLGRAQFDPEKPNYISAKDIAVKESNKFAKKTAKSTVGEFQDYIKRTYPDRYHDSY
ncbi:mTERF domain-containing protein 1 [Tropilaelaps mercedesae]|uniref:mTERF domain-containing protein 1 n=1 Tax=Tropilaelaps mercedesae TaxID=418985 RepID=A0A1V9Y1X0_9ACAR|nr:mTERF domain-containing protein 1 [Tropilaelaps mercedesae]